MSRSRQIPLCYWSIVGEEGERSSASGMLLSMICALRSHDEVGGAGGPISKTELPRSTPRVRRSHPNEVAPGFGTICFGGGECQASGFVDSVAVFDHHRAGGAGARQRLVLLDFRAPPYLPGRATRLQHA